MPSIPKLASALSLSLIEIFQLQYRRGLMVGRVSIQDWDLKEDPPPRKLVPTAQGGNPPGRNPKWLSYHIVKDGLRMWDNG
jgi:hypothetical protein